MFRGRGAAGHGAAPHGRRGEGDQGPVTNHSTAAGHVTQSSPLIGPGAGDHQGGRGDGRVRGGGAAGGLPAGGPHRGAR